MSGHAVVTGAAGFIGAHLVQDLAQDGVDVRAVDVQPDRERFRPGTVRYVRLDIRDGEGLAARIDGADTVYHLASAHLEVTAREEHYRAVNMQVGPAQRLVADSLEADWNAKLRARANAQQEYERQHTADRLVVDEHERKRVLALAAGFPTVWRASTTPQRERKRMLALLIEDVTLINQHHITVAVRFRAGATTMLTLPRPRRPRSYAPPTRRCETISIPCSTSTPMLRAPPS
jgi:NAD(P)-dependent dehydrogenase (short-subunit alcohol dehydrogenase family)